MFAVQLHKLGFHQLRRIVVTSNADGLAPGADGFKDQVYNLVQTVAVIGQIGFQNVIADVVLDNFLITRYASFASFRFRSGGCAALPSAGEGFGERIGMEWVLDDQ